MPTTTIAQLAMMNHSIIIPAGNLEVVVPKNPRQEHPPLIIIPLRDTSYFFYMGN
jgi:hypothetical protein